MHMSFICSRLPIQVLAHFVYFQAVPLSPNKGSNKGSNIRLVVQFLQSVTQEADLEVPLRVFAGDSALDGIPPRRGYVLLLANAKTLQRGPSSNLDLGLHQINLCDLFCHCVLHLQGFTQDNSVLHRMSMLNMVSGRLCASVASCHTLSVFVDTGANFKPLLHRPLEKICSRVSWSVYPTG